MKPPSPPRLVARDAAAIYADLSAHRAGYVAQWTGFGDAGCALHQVFARQLEVLGDGLNAMPQRAQLAFLDSLGADLLAAQPARAPLVFTLLDNASGHATVAQGTRVAAVLPPPPPTLEGDASAARREAPEFFTEQEITAMRGGLMALYSIDPQSDSYADHSAAARAAASVDGGATGFTAFASTEPVPHRLLLGHGELFRLTGNAQIELSIDFAPSRGGADGASQRPLLIDWEYLSVNGWQPLQQVSDSTWRFTRDGKIGLAKSHGPDSDEATIAGHTSSWIRGTVSQRVPGARIATEPAGYLLRYRPHAPAQNTSQSPAGFWLNIERWLGAAVFQAGDLLRIGNQAATVLQVSGARVVVDAALAEALPGAVVRDLANTPVGSVLAGPALADRIAWGPGASDAEVLAIDGQRVILATPADGIAAGDGLFTTLGDAFGSVTTAPQQFRVAVDSARELLPGDTVSADGRSHAVVVQSDDTALYLDTALPGLLAGLQLELADVLAPLRPEGSDDAGVLPQVDVIRAKVGFAQQDIPPDKALLDGFAVDTSKDFRPFGEQPARYASFYLACKSAFARRGAHFELHLAFVELGLSTHAPKVLTEYFNGARWVTLGANENHVDTSQNLTTGPQLSGNPPLPSATIAFDGPSDWEPTEINGDRQLWLRLRLAAGHYGHPLSVAVKADPANPGQFIVDGAPADVQAPVIARLGIDYLYFTTPTALDYCLVENDFAITDRSEDARWPRRPFAPFEPVSDRAPALHLGFSAQPPSALVSLLVQVAAPAEEGAAQPLVWDYWGARGWTELSVRDTTAGLRQSGLVQFVGATDALARDGLGGSLYRIRARLKSGLQAAQHVVSCDGVWLNAVWAAQGRHIAAETLGTSNGNPEQGFALPMARAPVGDMGLLVRDAGDFEQVLDQPVAGVPVLGGEEVWVREWQGRGDDWRTSAADVPATDLRLDRDAQDDTIVTAVWIRWQRVAHFYRSGPADRHYLVERARGVFRFPPAGGMVPPAGAPIRASYVTGGGVSGNVPAHTLRELRSGVGLVQSVTNPVRADGGAAAELLRPARARSAQTLRNRERAVALADYEWLARGASAEVAQARALALEGPHGRGSRGWVGLIVLPHSPEERPMPSAELLRTVESFLRDRMPAALAGRLRLLSPQYVPVSVRCELMPLRIDDAGPMEARLRARLARFFHPLRGSRDGAGWSFGAGVHLSDVATLVASTAGVEAVHRLELTVDGAQHGEWVPVLPHQLVAAGDSQLKILVPSVTHALA
jgi:hypothetical protein